VKTQYYIATASDASAQIWIQFSKVTNDIVQEFFQIYGGQFYFGSTPDSVGMIFSKAYAGKGWDIRIISEAKYKMLVRLGKIQ
jgi:hypothetical protein